MPTAEKAKYHFRGTPLTGIVDLKDAHKGGTGLILASGPTFGDYDNKVAPKEWPRFCINETIKALGSEADWWVLSDKPVVDQYSKHCPENVKILAMHVSTQHMGKTHCKDNKVWSINSMADVLDYQNGYEFYSRRTTVIAAVEAMRWMGFARVFIFGMDLFRTRSQYYWWPQSKALLMSNNVPTQHRVRRVQWKGQDIFRTPSLRQASLAIEGVVRRGLWNNIEVVCVSPLSQQEVLRKIDWTDFVAIVKKEAKAGGKEKKKGRKKEVVEATKKAGSERAHAGGGHGEVSGGGGPEDASASGGGEGRSGTSGGSGDAGRSGDGSPEEGPPPKEKGVGFKGD